MALTHQQWFEKLRSWVPTWFLDREPGAMPVIEGVFWALAKVAMEVEADMLAVKASTYITQASGGVIDAHGDERGVARLSGEIDSAFAARVSTFGAGSTLAATRDAINSALNGFGVSCSLHEGYDNNSFADEMFVSTSGQSFIFEEHREFNFFFVHIPSTGMPDGPAKDTLHANIIESIESSKAVGISYDVLSEA